MVNLEIQFFGFIVSHRFQNKSFVALWLCGKFETDVNYDLRFSKLFSNEKTR